jgi:hypothetical protein
MKTNWALQKYHHYSLADVENMLPWERLVYVDLIAQALKEEAEQEVDKRNLQRDLMSLHGKRK